MFCGVPGGVLTGRTPPSEESLLTDDLMTDDDAQRHGVGTQGRQMRVGAARLEAGDGGLGGVHPLRHLLLCEPLALASSNEILEELIVGVAQARANLCSGAFLSSPRSS